MKHILVPTDFSENAYNAISYAIQLYKNVTCTFYILHTYTPASVSATSMINSSTALSLHEIENNKVNKQLKAIKTKLENEFNIPNHSIITIASFDLLIPQMKDLINKYSINLVVMGTKGATGAKEIFIGSNTMYAIKKLKCPVIAVPYDYTYEAPKEILFPTNDHKISNSNKYLILINHLCEQHNSKLHFLNTAFKTQFENQQQETTVFLNKYFEKNAHLFHVSEGEELTAAIKNFEVENKVNLLIMIHNKRNFFENLLFKPTISQLVNHTNVPFLVIPALD